MKNKKEWNMKNFERAVNELRAFMAKNDVRDTVRISIVFKTDREKAHFKKGLIEEFQPTTLAYTSLDNLELDEFRLQGMVFRLLS